MTDIDDNMSFDNVVPSESEYLKKEDVGTGGKNLTIKGFSRTQMKNDQGGEDTKVIMHFQGDCKPMVLNKTNSQLIPIVTGAKTTGEAKGKQICVYNDPTISFGGRITGGIRIKSCLAPSAPLSTETLDSMNRDGVAPPSDDIPF